MKIALTQFDIAWEDKAVNRIRAEKQIKEAGEAGCGMIVFPEMTLTGFSMRLSAVAEMPGENGHTETVDWFLAQSLATDAVLVFGYAKWMPGHKKAANMLAVVQKGKLLCEYQKIHPFSYAGEDKYYAVGDHISGFMCQELCFGTFICYDLRFPEIFRLASPETEAFIVIANWPEERIDQWEALLRARAIENQCYMLGVNRCGSGDSLSYPESSMAFDPAGNRIGEKAEGKDWVEVFLEKETLRGFRDAFPVLQDRREDMYGKLKKSTFGIEKQAAN